MQIRQFRGLRYDDPDADSSQALGVMDLSSVIATTSDVSPDSKSGFAVGRLLDPTAEDVARQWIADGLLTVDPDDGLYVYRSGWKTATGQFEQGCGIIGLNLKSQHRLDVKVETVGVANSALQDLLEGFTGHPLARATDRRGAHHRLWFTSSSSLTDFV